MSASIRHVSSGAGLRAAAAEFDIGDPTTVATLFLVSRLGRLNDATLENIARRHRLTAAELYVLAPLYLWPEDDLTMSELSRAVLQSSGGITKTVTRLERAGLVKKWTDAQDRRIRRVRITARGRRAARACLDDAVGAYTRVLNEIDAEARPITLAALVTLLDAAEQASEDV